MDGAEACDGLEVSFVGVLGGDTKVEVDEEEEVTNARGLAGEDQ